MSSDHSKNNARIGGIVGGFVVAFVVGLIWLWRRNTSGRRRIGESEALLMSQMEEGTINAGKKKRTEEEVRSPMFDGSVSTTARTAHPPRKIIKREPSTAARIIPSQPYNVIQPNGVGAQSEGVEMVAQPTTFTPTGVNQPSVPKLTPPKPPAPAADPAQPSQPSVRPAVPVQPVEPVQPASQPRLPLQVPLQVPLLVPPVPEPNPANAVQPAPQPILPVPPAPSLNPEPDFEDPFEGGTPPPAPVFPLYRSSINNVGEGNCTVVVPFVVGDSMPEDKVVYTTEADCNTQWGSTLSALEQCLNQRQGELRTLEQTTASAVAALSFERQMATKLRADVNKASVAKETALQRLANLTVKYGEGHVTRDSHPASKSAVGRAFPTGDMVIALYKEWTSHVDTLAGAICGTLREGGQSPQAAAETFVQHVMLPVHITTAAYVQSVITAKQARMVEHFGPAAAVKDRSGDDVAWQFFLYTQQPRLLAHVRNLPQAEIEALMHDMDPTACQVQEQCPAVDLGSFVRKYLELHLLALLSDPRCYIHPAPGARVACQNGGCKEILELGSSAPGTQLEEGAQVEVVMGGLCLEDPARGGKPVAPLLVRRV